MYKLVKDVISGGTACIHHLADNAFIPLDPANTDYQKYLEWLAEGNVPLPADEEPK
jgi:hypothetical protein